MALNQTIRLLVDPGMLLLGMRVPFDVYAKSGQIEKLCLKKWDYYSMDVRKAIQSEAITQLFIEGVPQQIRSYFEDISHSDDVKRIIDEQLSYEEKKKASHHIEKKLMIDKRLFGKRTVIRFSIHENNNGRIVPVMQASPEKPALLPEDGLRVMGDLVIDAADIAEYQNYIQTLLLSDEISEEAKQAIKIVRLKEEAKIAARAVLTKPVDDSKIEAILRLADMLVDSLLSREVMFRDFRLQGAQDLYLYNHSMNVALLSVAAAERLGLQRDMTRKIAIGAFLHDIGKIVMPDEIVMSNKYLNEQEFNIFKTHPIEGVRILVNNTEIPREALIVILQHHEKLSGHGYPYRLRADKISLASRIVGIADSYDSLTTVRPFRYALDSFSALSVLQKEMDRNGDYDPQVLKEFVGMMTELPVE